MWSIIIATPNREKRLAKALTEAGFEVFLPLKRTWSGKYARHAEIRRPVMPGYVFAVLAPHQIHDFHGDGAVRMLRAFAYEQAAVDTCITGWKTDVELGAFDDPEPATRTKPIRHRNRRAKRTKQAVVTWAEGLKTILNGMTEETSLAA